MKRSQINSLIKEGMDFFKKMNWRLPPFAYWTIDEWRSNKNKTKLVRELMLGWDVTDFGSEDFDKVGSIVYTIRNGEVSTEKKKGVPYCEKLIYFRESQKLPLHFHFKKVEDIINRAGGIMVIQLYNSNEDYSVDYDSDIEIYLDSIKHTFKPGELVELKQGESITITPGIYHLFYSKPGEGPLLAGEVSTINDDKVDNYFEGDKVRFSSIDEDEELIYPLCNEYDQFV